MWWLSPASHAGHNYSHNIMWYSRRVILYIIKDIMALSRTLLNSFMLNNISLLF